MDEKKVKPATLKAVGKSPELSQDQLDEINFPELSKDQFHIGKQHFRIRVMPWKWERVFRKACLPIMESELKPFERAIYLFASELAVVKEDLGLTHSFTESEIDVDAHLTTCVMIICMSQDPEILKLAAEGQEIPLELQMRLEKEYVSKIEYTGDWPGGSARDYLRQVVKTQCEKMQLVQTLSKSLIGRLEELSTLTGMRPQFDSLKRGFSQQLQSFMEKAGRDAGIPASLSTESTGNGSATKPPETPSKTPSPEESPELVEKAAG